MTSNLNSSPDTPLSPSNPHHGYQTSPPPTSQVLQDAANNLQLVEAIQAVQPNWPPLEVPDEPLVEDVLEGHIVGVAVNNKVGDDAGAAAMPPIIFQDENGVDGDRALQDAVKSLDRLEWDDCDIPHFFNQAEIKMAIAGVKKQYTKFQVLASIIPKKVQDEVKKYTRKNEGEFPHNNAYKILKTEILRIFGPRPEEAVDRALGRVLVGKPSSLARALVNDLCQKELEGCTCCPAIILALWRRHLPGNVRAAISHMEFNSTTFDAVCKLADDVFQSNQPTPSIAAVSLDETQPAIPYATPEVAAIRGGNRGGRGGRGGRGRGRGNRGGGNAAATATSADNGPKHKGTKHPDLRLEIGRGVDYISNSVEELIFVLSQLRVHGRTSLPPETPLNEVPTSSATA